MLSVKYLDMVINIGYYKTMLKFNINQIKTNLSSYLPIVQKGEVIYICKRNIPVAKIVPIAENNIRVKRPVGLAKGEFLVPDNFNSALPKDVLDSFYGDE